MMKLWLHQNELHYLHQTQVIFFNIIFNYYLIMLTRLFCFYKASTKIQQVLRSWILQEHKLRMILANTEINLQERRVRQSTLVPYPNYDILISVLNPKPNVQNVKWDVRLATESNPSRFSLHVLFVFIYIFFPGYIQPFLNKINLLSKFTIKSQWIYEVPFEFPSKQVQSPILDIYYWFYNTAFLFLNARFKITRHLDVIMLFLKNIYHI